MATRHAWLIIDGYSLLHRIPECKVLLDRNLGLARQQLVRKIESTALTMADEVYVVFDGKGGAGEPFETPLSILFAPANLTADTVIERLVHGHSEPATLLVVTSDRMERQTVEAAGAETMSCGDFWARCESATQKPTPQKSQVPRPSLGDFFPEP